MLKGIIFYYFFVKLFSINFGFDQFIFPGIILLSYLYLRNLENTERPVYSVKAHSQIVNAIDGVGGLGIGEGAPEIVTASRDGKIQHSVYQDRGYIFNGPY